MISRQVEKVPPFPRNRVEIDLAALKDNYRLIREFLGENTGVLAVVKADGYGHGIKEVAESLQSVGSDGFCVADVEEGVILREMGIKGDIVVFLGFKQDECREIVEFALQPVVFDPEQLKMVASSARGRRVNIGLHLKVDIGMGRSGVYPDRIPELLQIIRETDGIYLAGLMSHFPAADAADIQGSLRQHEIFRTVCRDLRGGLLQGEAHIANTAAMVRFPEMHWDKVRPGISLYGYLPDKNNCCLPGLKPVMSLKTEIFQVKQVPADTGISYGHSYRTNRPSRLALIPLGYNEGYLRLLSNRAQALVHGVRVPQVGQICMNVTVLDVTDLPGEVRPGDEVVLMGEQGEEAIDADEIAGWMGTLNYEVLCLFGNLNYRRYLNKLDL
ncbi:MAG: alanine racemase [Desulfurivibrionaceae bacterium]